MSTSHTTQQCLLADADALIAAIMGNAPASELVAITDRIAAAVDLWDDIPPDAVADLRSAIDLIRSGQTCATVSALLAARPKLGAPLQS